MTVGELMDYLSTYPRDAFIGCGNCGIVSVDSLPSYYDGAHHVPEIDDTLGYHIRYRRDGIKVLLSAPDTQEIIESRFPLYTPIITSKFIVATKETLKYDQGLDVTGHYATQYNTYVISCLRDYYPKVTTWAPFWEIVCKAYQVAPQSQHDILQLHHIEEQHCSSWNPSPAENTPHITYAQLGLIAKDLMAMFPSARKASCVARYDQ